VRSDTSRPRSCPQRRQRLRIDFGWCDVCVQRRKKANLWWDGLRQGLALERTNISKASATVPLGATTTRIVSARVRFSGDHSDGRGIEDDDDGRDISGGANGSELGSSDLDNELDNGDLLEDDQGSYTHDSDNLLDDDEDIGARP
jgi:hypothetical protein